MKNPSFASHALRLIAAASLACTVATVGCTTDRTPGAGEPQRYTPTTGPTMPSSTPGSEQGRPLNPPMTSSYTQPRSFVMPARIDTDALAIAAANQSFRGRYLGTSDPAGVPSYVANPQAAYVQTGQFINPSDYANPEITVNSSISSQPTPVISSGGAGGAIIGSGAVVSGSIATTQAAAVGSTTSALTAGLATTPTTAATTVSPNVAANAPAGIISNAGGFLTPTMASGATMSPTLAANPGAGNAGATGTTTATATPATSGVRTSALSTARASVAAPIVITRSTNGTVTITNVTTSGLRLR